MSLASLRSANSAFLNKTRLSMGYETYAPSCTCRLVQHVAPLHVQMERQANHFWDARVSCLWQQPRTAIVRLAEPVPAVRWGARGQLRCSTRITSVMRVRMSDVFDRLLRHAGRQSLLAAVPQTIVYLQGSMGRFCAQMQSVGMR